jgi:hypothetical protein
MARQLAEPERAGLHGLKVVYFTVLGERATPEFSNPEPARLMEELVRLVEAPRLELVLADALAVAARETTIDVARTDRTILRGNDFFMPQVTQTEHRLRSKSGRTVKK